MSDQSLPVTFEVLRSRIDTIRDVIAKEATGPQLNLFAQVCVSMQLNPFAEEVYWSSALKKVLVSHKGYLRLVKRTGAYRGIYTYVVYEGDTFTMTVSDGVPHVVHETDGGGVGAIRGAYTFLHMDGYEAPIFAWAPWRSFCRPSDLWKNFPEQAIRKAVERLACQKAFGDSDVSPSADRLSVVELDEGVAAITARAERDEDIRERITGTTPADVDVKDERTKLVAAIERLEGQLADAGWDGWNVKPRRLGSRTKHAGTTALAEAPLLKLREYYDHLVANYDAMNAELDAVQEKASSEVVTSTPALDSLFDREPGENDEF